MLEHLKLAERIEWKPQKLGRPAERWRATPTRKTR